MPYQEIDFPFSGGIDEKTQSQLVEPGAALVVSNLRQQKNGSYQKVEGNDPLNRVMLDGSSFPVGKRLIAYKDELLQSDGMKLEGYLPAKDSWKKVLGYVPQAQVSSISIVPVQAGLTNWDCAAIGNIGAAVYTLQDDAGHWDVFAALVDLGNNALIVPPVNVSGTLDGLAPPTVNVLAVGANFVITWSLDVSESTNIYATYLETTSDATIMAGWSPPLAIISGAACGSTDSPWTVVYDVCTISSTKFAIAYVQTTFANAITVTTFDQFLSPGGATIDLGTSNASSVRPSAVAIAGSVTDSYIWVAFPWDDDVNVVVVGLDPSTLAVKSMMGTVLITQGGPAKKLSLAVVGPAQGIVVASRYNDGLVGYGVQDYGGSMRACRFFDNGTTQNIGTPLRTHWSQGDVRPFLFNNRIYAGYRFRNDLKDQDSVYLVDLTATFADQVPGTGLPNGVSRGYLRPITHVFPRLTQNLLELQTHAANLARGAGPHALVSGSKIRFLVPLELNAEAASLELVTVDFSDVTVCQPATLGEGVALSGSLPSYYDGLRCNELGFLHRPAIISTTPTGSPTGSNSSAYSYVAVYEQIDARGQWHQSNVSNPFVPPTQPQEGQGVAVEIATLQTTNRVDASDVISEAPGQIRIVLYRTTGEATVSADGIQGTVYFRVPKSETLNDQQRVTIFIQDDVSDTDLTANGIVLYTQPGVPNVAQPKVNPPALSNLIRHGNRLVGSNGNVVWYSGQIVSGDAPWFSDLFQFSVGDSSNITALASLDGALVVFKRDSIAFVDGEGPPDNGTGGDFSSPQFIAADVGCINPRSLVTFPAGVMFQSLRGIELLTRGRSLANYFGSAVEKTLQANPVITSAVLDETKSTVTFTCVPSDSSSTGVELIWDYVHQFWTIRTLGGGAAVYSSVMWGQQTAARPRRTWLLSDGTILVEGGRFLDSGAYVESQIQTPWIKMSGLQGYGRTMSAALLMEMITPCTIQIDVEQDYREGPTQTRTFSTSEIQALRDPKQLLLILVTQKCESVRFTFTDKAPVGSPTGIGQGARFIGLRIQYMQKQGRNRLPKNAG